MQTYHLFISHSWNYSDAHDRLVKLLTAHPTFTFKNFSVPHNQSLAHKPTSNLSWPLKTKSALVRRC